MISQLAWKIAFLGYCEMGLDDGMAAKDIQARPPGVAYQRLQLEYRRGVGLSMIVAPAAHRCICEENRCHPGHTQQETLPDDGCADLCSLFQAKVLNGLTMGKSAVKARK